MHGGHRLPAPVLVLGAACRRWELAVHVVETGCWCWCRAPARPCWALVLGAVSWCRCSVLVPASDSEVITTAASDVKGNKPPLAAVKGDQAPLLTMKRRQSWAA